MLSQDMYTIFDHDKFYPSTRPLFNEDKDGRGYVKHTQNPSKADIKRGIYKPRLTLTRRPNRLTHRPEKWLKVEFSIPKLMFGNNFDELSDDMFDDVLKRLKEVLLEMGVPVHTSRVRKAGVSLIHYGKNVVLDDYTTPHAYIQELNQVDVNQQLDVNQSDYRNGGHSWKYRANNFEVIFYDKLKDLKKAKISEKRAEEKDNYSQLGLFDKRELKKPFEVLRMEVRLNNRRKIKQVLKQLEIDVEPTFENLYGTAIARKVLLNELDRIKGQHLPLFSVNENLESLYHQLRAKNPIITPRKLLQVVGSYAINQEVGLKGLRHLIETQGKTSWYGIKKDLKAVNAPKPTDTFNYLEQNIREFEQVQLKNYPGIM